MNKKAVVFDLDGTLLYTLEDIAFSMNRVLEKKGFHVHPTHAFRHFIGDGSAMMVRRSLPESERTDSMIAGCMELFKKEYLNNWSRTTHPYEGIVETLDRLAKKNVKLAVLSNKPKQFTKLCVDRFLDNNKFQMVVGQCDGIPPKPDPKGAKLIAERLNVEPDRFLYVGDSGVDMKTAQCAGMVPVGVLWGFRDREELIQSGARAVVSRPPEIISLVQGIHF
jgi:phosphoglycolate phosphatase